MGKKSKRIRAKQATAASSTASSSNVQADGDEANWREKLERERPNNVAALVHASDNLFALFSTFFEDSIVQQLLILLWITFILLCAMKLPSFFGAASNDTNRIIAKPSKILIALI